MMSKKRSTEYRFLLHLLVEMCFHSEFTSNGRRTFSWQVWYNNKLYILIMRLSILLLIRVRKGHETRNGRCKSFLSPSEGNVHLL